MVDAVADVDEFSLMAIDFGFPRGTVRVKGHSVGVVAVGRVGVMGDEVAIAVKGEGVRQHGHGGDGC